MVTWRQNVTTIAKDPDAVLDYVWDWSAWLDDGDTIASHQVVAETGITVDSSAVVDGQVTVWLSGGTESTVYDVTVRIVTTAGRKDDRTVKFSVLER